MEHQNEEALKGTFISKNKDLKMVNEDIQVLYNQKIQQKQLSNITNIRKQEIYEQYQQAKMQLKLENRQKTLKSQYQNLDRFLNIKTNSSDSRNDIDDKQHIVSARSLNSPDQIPNTQIEIQAQKNLDYQEMKQILDNIQIPTQRTRRKFRRELLTDYISGQMFKENKKIKSREQNLINILGSEDVYKQFKLQNQIGISKSQKSKTYSANRSKNIKNKSESISNVSSVCSYSESMPLSDSICIQDIQQDFKIYSQNDTYEDIQNKYYNNQNTKVKDSILQSYNSSRKDIYFNIRPEATNMRNSVQLSTSNLLSQQISQNIMIELRDRVVEILKKPSNKRTEEDLQQMVEYFTQFDFIQKEKKQIESNNKMAKDLVYRGQNQIKNKSIHTEVVTEKPSLQVEQASVEVDQLNELKKSIDVSESKSIIKTDQIFSCDLKSVEKQCHQMKYLVLQNDESIYDYGSQGESFYMLISGEVTCKVPSHQQLVFLSQEEKNLFQLQFRDDIVDIQDAKNENLILEQKYAVNDQNLAEGLSDDVKVKNEQKLRKINIKLSKITLGRPLFKNPYMNMQLDEYQLCIDKLLEKERSILHLKYQKENKKMKEKSKNEIESNNYNNQSTVNKSVDSNVYSSNNSQNSQNIQNQVSREKSLKQENLLGNNVSQNEVNYIYQNKHYVDLEQACQNLLSNFQNQQKRQYYKLKVFKSIKVIKEFESFGEISLISDKARAEKMVVSGNTHAQFAVLSKKDYKLAIGKIQNMVNQNRVNFLKQLFVFKNLSDSALSGLSQVMKEQTYCKGQFVYQEDIDIADKIYIVQKGRFKSIKKIPILQNEKKEIDLQMILRQKKETDDDSEIEEEGIIDMDKFKKQDAVNRYQNIPQKKHRVIDVCIHSQFDIFGYEQFFSEEQKPKICHSVLCLQKDSVVISINKKYLNNHIRRNTAPYILLVDAWKGLVAKRSLQTLNGTVDDNFEVIKDAATKQNVNKRKTREQIMKEVQDIKMFSVLTNNLNYSQDSIQVKDDIFNKDDGEEKQDADLLKEQLQSNQQKFVIDKRIDIDFKLQKVQNNRQNEKKSNKQKVSLQNAHIIESSNIKKNIDDEKISSQDQNIDIIKKNMKVDFSDFRKSILGSVSHTELKNIKAIESQIQKKLFINRNQQNTKTEINQNQYPINGSINSSQLILQSYTILKQIKMRQQVLNAQKQAQNSQIKKNNLNKDFSGTDLESTEKSVGKLLRNEEKGGQMLHQMSRLNIIKVSAFNSFNNQSTTLVNHPNVLQSDMVDLTESLNNSKIQNQIFIESMINSDEMACIQNNHLTKKYQDDGLDYQRNESQNKQVSNQNIKQINFQQMQDDLILNSQFDQSVQRQDEYQNQFIQNSMDNTIRSKTSNQINLTREEQEDWNKESNIVQSQCQRFMLKTRNMNQAHSFLDADISFMQNQKSTLNSRNQPSLEVINPQNEYHLNNEIQRKIQNSVVSQKNYDFDKDIENLIRLKKQRLKGQGDDCTTLFSSYKSSISNSENKKEKRNLQSLRDKQQSQMYKLKLDLLSNPIINMKQIKKKDIQRTFQVSNEKRKRRVINIYNSSNSRNIFVPSCLSNSNLKQTIQNNGNQIQDTTIVSDQNHFSKYENTENQLKLKLQRTSTLKQNLANMGILKIEKNQSNLLQNKSTKYLQKDKNDQKIIQDSSESNNFKSKFSLPKIIMRQILFENNELNQKIISEQDLLRQIYQEQNSSQIEVKKGSYDVKITKNSLYQQVEAYHSIPSLPPNNFIDNNSRNAHLNQGQIEKIDLQLIKNNQGRNQNFKTQTIFQTLVQKQSKLDKESKYGEKEYILQEDQHDQNVNKY